MRKLFLAICFISILIHSQTVFAAAKPVSDMDAGKAKQGNAFQLAKEVEEEKQKTRAMSPQDMDAYLKQRIGNVVATQISGDEGLNGDSSVSIEKTPEMIAAEQAADKEAKKSTFEKIYDNAMNRLISPNDKPRTAPIYKYTPNAAEIQAERAAVAKQQEEAWARANIDVIDITLPPYGEKALVPAKEHIPYLFSKIELLPDGLIRFTDTITVVANGEKLKDGVIRAFPKYVLTRMNEKQKIDFNLLYVTINGQQIEYSIWDRGDYIVIKPKTEDILPNGVYDYEFSYLIDNQVFQYDEFDEFYWNLTGSSWNLVIGRIGATVILPPNTQTLGQAALSGYPGYWRDDTILINKESENALGFVSTEPLFIGQGLQIIVSIPKGVVSHTDLNKHFLRFINANGDIVFSLFGLIAIVAAYIFSWRYIRNNKNAKIDNLTKDAPILRYLVKGLIDKKSFGAFLLDLQRKNIIDIEENDGNVLLIKRTDNLGGLSRDERKAVNNLFANSESVLNINSYSMLKVKRAFESISKGIKNKLKFLSLKLNLGYLLFSIGMLLLAEASIAALSYGIVYNFAFMTVSTIIFATLLLVLHLNFKNIVLTWGARITAAILLALTWFVLCAIVSPIAAFIIFITVCVIMEYSKLYAKRSGLLGTSVNAANDYQQLLIRKVNDISLGKDFLMHQAAIFALDLESFYKENESTRNYYKLDIIGHLIKKL